VCITPRAGNKVFIISRLGDYKDFMICRRGNYKDFMISRRALCYFLMPSKNKYLIVYFVGLLGTKRGVA
jgi:hypothetical protein